MALMISGGSRSSAALVPEQVLVVYNSRHADSLAVWQHYESKRPGVHGFDLDDPSLAPGTIHYPDFIARLRTPLRTHLQAEGLAEQVVVLVLTKGLPHRIRDMHAGDVGDQAGNALNRINAGKATYASVDSELTLLWQDLDSGEAGGAMDSPADNRIENPYFNKSTPAASSSRSGIRSTRHFAYAGSQRWRMTTGPDGVPCTVGDMYLVSRLDGNSLEAVLGMINRGLAPWYDPQNDLIIQDRNATGGIDGGDYTLTEILIESEWPAFHYDTSSNFLIGATGNLPAGNAGTSRITGRVAALTGYGGNHDGYNRSGFMATYAGQLGSGAVYNAYESFNARKFGGVGGFGDHGQLSDWVDNGGTFGVGNAWEPLSDGATRNHALLLRYFVDGLSWVESAWSGAPFLSWQTIVIGDPLAVASFTPPPTATLSATGTLAEIGDVQATVELELSEPAAVDTEVNLSFTGADSEEDFQLIGCPLGCVTVEANERTATFDIVALADQLPEGTEWLEVRVEAGGGYQSNGSAVVLPIADSPFGEWLVDHFGAAAPDELPGSDTDRDGFSNLLEYVMDLDPRSPDRDRGPALSRVGGEAVYRFPINPQATDVTWKVEVSSDLSSWLPHPAEPAVPEAGDNLMEARVSMTASGRRFFRLSVAGPQG